MQMDHNPNDTRFVREFACHGAAIHAYIRRLVPSRADSDDVFQEVAVVLWQKFSEFRQEECFRSWAFGVARFKVLSWVRDKGRRRLVLDLDILETIADESENEDRHLEERRIAFDACFKQLSAEHQSLLAEAYQAKAKVQDIASASGRSIAGFYQWLYRMRRILLECVEGKIASEAAK